MKTENDPDTDDET